MLTSFPLFRARQLKILIFALSVSLVTHGCAGAPRGDRKSSPEKGLKILKTAKSQIGKKYCFGGISPKTGFDCSGLAWWSHRKNGINIPRQSWDQYKEGKKISRNNLMAGDLLYFETYKKGASHVGVYDGKGGFIHSPNSNKKVQRTSLKNSYYKKRYLGARRFWQVL
ncbi:MAG: C40 family peptidase [bacterium]|nr:C40 family peptidase [bacterium]